jgi:UPF0755 protein
MRALKFLLLLAVVAAAAVAGAAWWWLQTPLPLAQERVELSIEPGQSPREVAHGWVRAGVQTSPDLLYAWFRLSGQDRAIRAGSFEVETGISPRGLLDKMVRGDEVLSTLRLIEGWTFRQVRTALAAAPHLRQTLAGKSDLELMQAIGAPGVHPEGRFFPDTYAFSRGASDEVVLRRAFAAMQRRVDEAWAARPPETPLRSPDELLALASIVEKETGVEADRGKVAGVFLNRLRIGMMLQTDPTVIYGLGERFDGNLRKRDLQADTPYNTYTRGGLPPTPIALPGRAALEAAVDPADGTELYFVSRGDGSHQFSTTYREHLNAVRRYQLGGGRSAPPADTGAPQP